MLLRTLKWSLRQESASLHSESLRCMKNRHPNDVGSIKECQYGTDGPNLSPHLHVNFIALCPCPCKWSRRGDRAVFILRLHMFLCSGIPAYPSIKHQCDFLFYFLPLNVTLKAWAQSVSSVFISMKFGWYQRPPEIKIGDLLVKVDNINF